MKPTDLATVEEWKNIQALFSAVTGLTLITFDLEGNALSKPQFRNQYCMRIKSTVRGSKLCKQAHKEITGKVIDTDGPVIGTCDAGLIKVAVPIKYEGKIVGVTGGCGVYMKINGLDIAKLMEVGALAGLDNREVRKLSKTIKGIDNRTINEEIDILNEKVKAIIERNCKTL